MADTLSNADTGVGADRGAPTGTSRWQKAVGILGVLVVLWVGNDTYKVIDGDFGGVGGGGGVHGPAPTTPVENEDQAPGTDDGGGHQPPAGGHG